MGDSRQDKGTFLIRRSAIVSAPSGTLHSWWCSRVVVVVVVGVDCCWGDCFGVVVVVVWGE